MNMPPGCPFARVARCMTSECNDGEPELVPVETPEHLARCMHSDLVDEQADPRVLFEGMPDTDDVLPSEQLQDTLEDRVLEVEVQEDEVASR